MTRTTKFASATTMREARIEAPEQLCVYSPRACPHTLRFLSGILDGAVLQGKRVTADLSQTKTFTAAAALMLFANVTAAQLITGRDDAVEVKMPMSKECRKAIRAEGLYHACRPGGTARLERLWDENSQFLSGADPFLDYERTISAITQKLGHQPSDAVCRAITEAILNVSHHAYEFLYDTDPIRRLNKRWWQYFDVDESGLTVLFYDLGMGIPRTMDPNGFEASDEILLDRAMTRGVSRLKDQGRGQGSADLKRPVQNSEFSSLFILSNKARLEFLSAQNVNALRSTEYSVRGTYIEWTNTSPARIHDEISNN